MEALVMSAVDFKLIFNRIFIRTVFCKTKNHTNNTENGRFVSLECRMQCASEFNVIRELFF